VVALTRMSDDFSKALVANMADFGFEISVDLREGLAAYYNLLLRWNDRLHLVAPCSAEEFAVRHVLESLLLINHLPTGSKIVDVGSGAGLPIIPCMIVRPDLVTTLVESSQKKSVFLREAMNQLGLKGGTIICKTFEETPTPDVAFVSCRALDEFLSKLQALLKWAPATSNLLLLGGASLKVELDKVAADFCESLIPHSNKRFLFVVKKY
jgi:16S rRNA (guanine527-N7)-methyltransferase